MTRVTDSDLDFYIGGYPYIYYDSENLRSGHYNNYAKCEARANSDGGSCEDYYTITNISDLHSFLDSHSEKAYLKLLVTVGVKQVSTIQPCLYENGQDLCLGQDYFDTDWNTTADKLEADLSNMGVTNISTSINSSGLTATFGNRMRMEYYQNIISVGQISSYHCEYFPNDEFGYCFWE